MELSTRVKEATIAAEQRGRDVFVNHRSRMMSRYTRTYLCNVYGASSWLDIPSEVRSRLYKAFYNGVERGQDEVKRWEDE